MGTMIAVSLTFVFVAYRGIYVKYSGTSTIRTDCINSMVDLRHEEYTISDLRDEQLFMNESDLKEIPAISPLLFEDSDVLDSSEIVPILDADGYEWIKNEHGEYLYRRAGSNGEWMKYES